MTLDQIETFLAVADCGSFKAASDQLHRSQPALSVAVKKLEEELGVQLFNREQYRPSLSTHGKAFYTKAKEFYLQSQSLEKFARQLGMGEEPEISIAVESLCPVDLVLDALDSFSRSYPDTRLNISFEVLGGAAEKLEKGQVQLALSPSITEKSEGFECEPLVNVWMIPVVAKNAAVFQMTGAQKLNLDHLKNFPQIIVSDSSTTPSQQSFGVLEGARQWTVKDMETKARIIKRGLGWGRLPRHYIESELKSGALKELNLNPFKKVEYPIFLMASPKHPIGPLTTKLKEVLLNAASKA
jgi:DNA-binding transcriptional LysR family regulator